MKEEVFDFSGYATKNDLLCSDGRTIKKDAFKHMDGQRVPLVWQHVHNDPTNVLGYGVLENRPDGVYVRAKFNDTRNGQDAKKLVQHGDINSLSIFANQLVQKGTAVHSGMIREVSLVLAGANPGALIDNISITHGDGSSTESDDEAVIYTGLGIELEKEKVEHSTEDKTEPALEHAKEEDETVEDVMKTLTPKQMTVVSAVITQALEANTEEVQHSNDQGDADMKENVFDGSTKEKGPTLTHDQMKAILDDAKKTGSLKESFLAHAGTYGIDDIGFLFPDARALTNEPTLITRDMGWVRIWMNKTNHTPFSRIKSLAADITEASARALGYITGELKKEEVFGLLKRITTPTTVYKKQKLDRDDIIDITDFDVVAWLKREMRIMLDEEVARAALVSDGRAVVGDDDKINETNIRPIYKDDVLYAIRVDTLAADDPFEIIDKIVLARSEYKGSGNPTLFATTAFITSMLMVRDTLNRRVYRNLSELALELRVDEIVEVPVMTGVSRVVDDVVDYTTNLLGIMVNPRDYTYGADKGGALGMFDDFDIDYNQYKYLLETRVSGALTLPKSAMVIEQRAA